MNLLKRFFAVLITALLLVSCHASAESAEYDEWPKLIQVLQDAGRETGNILASEVYPMDTPETAVFLVQAGDTAQLTVLKSENGAWRITAQNDTIPVSIITDAKLTITSQTDPGGGWIISRHLTPICNPPTINCGNHYNNRKPRIHPDLKRIANAPRNKKRNQRKYEPVLWTKVLTTVGKAQQRKDSDAQY